MTKRTTPLADRRRTRIGRLIETGRTDDAIAALLAEAAAPGVVTRHELATGIGVTRQTLCRWLRTLGCGDALDDALYVVDRRGDATPPRRPPYLHGPRCDVHHVIGGRCNCGVLAAP